jgi:hypothetical protein
MNKNDFGGGIASSQIQNLIVDLKLTFGRPIPDVGGKKEKRVTEVYKKMCYIYVQILEKKVNLLKKWCFFLSNAEFFSH